MKTKETVKQINCTTLSDLESDPGDDFMSSCILGGDHCQKGMDALVSRHERFVDIMRSLTDLMDKVFESSSSDTPAHLVMVGDECSSLCLDAESKTLTKIRVIKDLFTESFKDRCMYVREVRVAQNPTVVVSDNKGGKSEETVLGISQEDADYVSASHEKMEKLQECLIQQHQKGHVRMMIRYLRHVARLCKQIEKDGVFRKIVHEENHRHYMT